MRALITGGAGFIGSTLVDQLLDAGHEVTVIDDFSSGRHENLSAARDMHGEHLQVIEHDLREPGTEKLVANVQPDVVCHLAAQIDVRVSVADPALDASVNIIALLRVLEGARAAGTRKVVFASSGGTIYGDVPGNDLPVTEAHPQVPLSPYGVSKKVAADYLEVYRVLHGIEWLALALANVYGPRQDPHGEAGVVAIFVGRMLDNETCTIFGDGEQTRDYVYVQDVAEAFILGVTAGSGLVNIGTGIETSVVELHQAVANTTGVPGTAQHAEARSGELARSALDATRAASELAWAPRTDLAAGIAETVAWFRTKDLRG